MISYDTLIVVLIKCALNMVDTHTTTDGNGVLGEERWPTGVFQNRVTSREKLNLKSKIEAKMELTWLVGGFRGILRFYKEPGLNPITSNDTLTELSVSLRW